MPGIGEEATISKNKVGPMKLSTAKIARASAYTCGAAFPSDLDGESVVRYLPRQPTVPGILSVDLAS